MSLDGFLTALSLVVAIFAVVSPYARLKLRLRMRSQIFLGAVAFFSVMYFEFFDLVGQPCFLEPRDFCGILLVSSQGSFKPQDVAFFVVVFWFAAAYSIYSLPRVNARVLPVFRRLLDWLLVEKHFSEAISLSEPNFELLMRASKRKLLAQRISDYVNPEDSDKFSSPVGFLSDKDDEEEDKKLWINILPRRLRAFGVRSLSFITSEGTAEESANEILDLLMKSHELRRYIATTRPYAAIPLLDSSRYGVREFSNEFLQLLLSDLDSALYRELSRSHELSDKVGFVLGNDDRILGFYLSDLETMEKFGVWKPVGDFVLRNLRTDHVTDYSETLKRRPDYFDADSDRDPTFLGIQFFDLLVTRAAYQGARWHMWLHYIPLIVGKLEEHYDASGQGVDESDEFPILASRLIYECISTLGSWVLLYQDLPEDSILREVDVSYERSGGRIPTASAEALGRALHTVVSSHRIDRSFAAYMLEVVVRRLSQLDSEGQEGRLRAFLVTSIVSGGGRDVGEGYRFQLADLLHDAQYLYLEEIEDLREALRHR